MTPPAPLDVAVLAPYLTRRQAGAGQATVIIVNALARSAWARVRVLSFEVEPGLLDPGVPVTTLPAPALGRGMWRLEPWPSYRHAVRALRAAMPAPADFCYTQSPVFGPAYRRVFPRAHLASHTGAVLWAREVAEESEAGGAAARLQAAIAHRLERRTYHSRAWDHLVSTALVARERARAFGLTPAHFTVQPLPIDDARFDPARPHPDVRAALGIPQGAFVVATVARLVGWKNVAWVVEAVRGLGADAHLVVVGDGPERGRLEALAGEDAGRRVHLVGWQDPAAYVRAADAFALPSTIESFGMVYAEAMMMGVPCLGLAADPPRVLSAAQDVIAEGETGYCVRTPDELRARLAELAGDPALRTRLARRAREVARERFTPAAYVGRLAQLAGAA